MQFSIELLLDPLKMYYRISIIDINSYKRFHSPIPHCIVGQFKGKKKKTKEKFIKYTNLELNEIFL